jgi:membrane fusion protein (multidrug efflux system)
MTDILSQPIGTIHSAPATPAQTAQSRRKILFMGLGGAVLSAALAAGLYWYFIGAHYVSTDNAYVDASVAQVTPQVSAAVTAVNVIETQHVNAGDVLITLDDSDAKIALMKAQAQLDQIERRVRGYFANEDSLAGQQAAREAEIASANAQVASASSELDRARTELKRREGLAASGAVSGEEMTSAQSRFKVAQATLDSARAALAQAQAQRRVSIGSRSVNKALIENATIDTNPEVQAARAQVASARLDLDRSVIRSPIAGIVARSTVQIGQRVPVGATLMSIVPVDDVYVNANFKEVELTDVRIGQPVTLTSDLYGSSFTYHGKVVGLSGGTGSAFALIPAQNATGNWIKVVQRLPVRIALDPAELHARPLRIGLSMVATIHLVADNQ